MPPQENSRRRPKVVSLLAETARSIENEISKSVGTQRASVQEMIDHALAPRGIRERPLLVRLSCEAVGGSFETVIHAAVAVELFHFSTLVLDDIFDEATLRGGEETVCSRYGICNAIIVAQILEAQASRALTFIPGKIGLVQTERSRRAFEILAETKHTLYFGQYEDLACERNICISESDYIDMVRKTTGSLLACCTRIGATLGGGTEQEVECLGLYGENLGIALQIRDDLSEVIGDPKVIGKNLGGDIKQQKMRLPLIELLRETKSETESASLRVALQKSADDDAQLADVLHRIRSGGAVDRCKRSVEAYCAKAEANLAKTRNCEARESLLELTHLVSRQW